MRGPLRLIYFLFLLALSACSHLFYGNTVLPIFIEPRKHIISEVPFFPQKEFQCGPSALAAALTFTGASVTPEQLESEIFTPDLDGTLQAEILSGARRHDRSPYLLPTSIESILNEIANGRPVIVLLNLGLSWYKIWHYALVIGYDLDNQTITISSGRKKEELLSVSAFNNTWARSEKWAVLILKPGELPIQPDPDRFIESIIGLERIKNWEGAIRSYQTALKLWPENELLHSGLGLAFYETGKLSNAIDIFDKFLSKNPNSEVILNNYADILKRSGRLEKAYYFIKRAVNLNGKYRLTCLKTLQEVETLLNSKRSRSSR